MKYFAILKDSLREALDSKLLIVLVILSTIVIGTVACFSFQSLSAETTMKMFFPSPGQPPWIPLAINSHRPEKILAEEGADLFGGGMQLMSRRQFYSVTKVTLLRGEEDQPESDYELIITQGNWLHGQPAPKHFADKETPIETVRDLFKEAAEFGFVKIGDVSLDANQELNMPTRFRVVLEGTPRTHRIWATQLFFMSYTWPSVPKPLGLAVFELAQRVIMIGSWVAVLSGVIITSFFIPNMLRKGSVDLLLAKPIHRWTLLTYKYLGGLTFIFLVTGYSIGGIWLAIGIRSGLWANASLLLIFSITFFFAILYAVSTFVGVVVRNALVAIVVTVLAWAAFAAIGMFHNGAEVFGKVEKMMVDAGKGPPPEDRWADGKLFLAINIIHAITPHTEDLNRLNENLVFTSIMTGDLSDARKFDSSEKTWTASIIVSLAWIGIFLGLGAAWFTYKDY